MSKFSCHHTMKTEYFGCRHTTFVDCSTSTFSLELNLRNGSPKQRIEATMIENLGMTTYNGIRMFTTKQHSVVSIRLTANIKTES